MGELVDGIKELLPCRKTILRLFRVLALEF